MRTTLRIDDELMKEAKGIAARTGHTLTEVIEDLMRESLARRRGRQAQDDFHLHTFKGGRGVQPGVDLSSSAALLDLMEGLEDAPTGRERPR